MKYSNIIFIYLLFFFYPFFSFGQDKIIGVWKGELFQKPNRKFYFELRIEAIDELGNYRGTTFIQRLDNKISKGKKGKYATISLDGKYDNGMISFQEKRMLKGKNTTSFYWCKKSAQLYLNESKGEYFLQGNWNSPTGSCNPGFIKVKKEFQRINETYKPDKLSNREIEIKKSIEVISNQVQIKLWDNNKQDGDIISVYLNDSLILNNFTVLKKKKKINLDLNNGSNVLVIHTINLGSQPPNTAAISVIDGKNKSTLILRSNMNKSAAIEIIKE